MSLLFVHDHKFRKINGDLYSTGGLNDNVLTRYVDIFNSVYVVARVVDESEVKDHYSLIKNEKVKIIERASLSSNELKKMICDNSHIIVRLPSKFGTEVAYYAAKLKKPYMVEMVGCAWDSLKNHSIKGKIVALPLFLITKAQTKRANYVLYVTEKFLQSRYPTNGKKIGVSDVIITPMSDEEIQNRLLKVKNMKQQGMIKLVTTAAVNVAYKGQRFVIEALSILKKKGITNLEYHLLGSGDQTALKELAKNLGLSNRVIFHGNVKHEELNDLLDTFDIYIQPSLQEGLPRALVEAMSRGLICIGAKTGGIPELIESKWVCKDKKNLPLEIAKKIEAVLSGQDVLYSVEYNINRSNDFREECLSEKRDNFMKEFLNCL